MLFHSSPSLFNYCFLLSLALDYVSDTVVYCYPKHALGPPPPQDLYYNRTASVGKSKEWVESSLRSIK